MTITLDKPINPVKPPKPWTKRNKSTVVNNAIAVILPTLILGILFFTTEIPGPVLVVVVFFPLQLLTAGVTSFMDKGKRGIGDSILSVGCVTAFGLVVALLGSVVLSVIARGFPAMRFSFLFQNNIYISPTTELTYGGIGHALLGTLLVVFIASIIAVPLGIASAIYITDIKGRASGFVRFMVQAMSGVPSIVAGLFIFAAVILTDVVGFSAIAGGLAYAILMLPTVARTAEEVLRLVPKEVRDAAVALGSSRARVTMRIVLPTAKTGLITAVVLGVARIIGETAPLLLTTSNANNTNLNPFSDPVSTIPVYIFQYLGSGYQTSIQRAWGAALVLLLAVAILFALTRYLSRNKKGNV